MSVENQKPGGFSNDEFSLAENKTLLKQPATAEQNEEQTRRFEVLGGASGTAHKIEFGTEPTEVLETQDEALDKLHTVEDENALKPSRLRFSVICFLCFLAVVNSLVSFYKYTSTKVEMSWEDGFAFTESDFAFGRGEFAYFREPDELSPNEIFQYGDKVVSINNLPIKKRADVDKSKTLLIPYEPYKVLINRGNQTREIEFVAEPISITKQITNAIEFVVIPVFYILIGLFVFLLKPNDKLTNALAAFFFISCMGASLDYIRATDYPGGVSALHNLGMIIWGLSGAVFLHFFLIFPRKARVLRRFPKLEYLLYLPAALIIIPYFLSQYFEQTQSLNLSTGYLSYLTMICYLGYFLTGIASLVVNYFRSDIPEKRKIRFIVISILLIPLLILLLFVVGILLGIIDMILYKEPYLVNIALTSSLIISYLNFALIPLIFAYAIVRHKVIPISFVIRRGLQYVLAKNALRLLLVLPIVGMVWNIVANPSRRLDEILLQNSPSFYLFALLATGLILLNRFGLREWVDRKFFRVQYNQEKILRELTEAVKESDSLVKLSRLVSSKIQLALHPENVYLFFRDDANQSGFSLGFTTDSGSENSSNLKLAADSPLLRFMQQQRGAVEFPSRQGDELPNREKRRLREIGANLLVPMHGTDGRLAGIFLLGEKLSEIPYTGRDKELLETLANQIALVHENLSLKDRVRREQRIKTEVLARFEEGNINLLKECPTCGRCFDRDVINCPEDNSKLNFTLPVERTIENRYRLEKLLGRGGMGSVYEAMDLRINRKVAVKILSGAKFGNREALRRFEREAQSAGRLNHKNIVTIYDYGTLSTEGAFLVMELVYGESLSDIFKREGKLSWQTAARWFKQILDGVETAHKAGIIHRDLKPDNIFVVSDEGNKTRLCILDFGLARLNEMEIVSPSNATMPGMIMGTLGYMSPEQLRGERVDERADLFAVGVMIYEALYGEKPFRGQTFQELRLAMTQEISFDLEQSKARFFEQALALNPENRFASASEMKQALLDL